ncbi:MAG: MFS transporter [Promethearchaeota archaeon]|nr:MAG: MFS transporter [Candidatus Lokiarchaeota archaeon]
MDKKNKYPQLNPLWISVFVDILGFSIILPFLPFFIAEFNASPAIIGFLLSSNAIFGFIFGPILSKLSDNYGRKPMMLISLGGTFLGFIILILSNNIIVLLISRIIDGIFSGQFPIARAIIGDVVTPEDRPKQMTNIGISFGLAFLIGPAIGGLLSSFGFIGPGIIATILTGFSFVYTAIYLKESLPNKVKNSVLPEKIIEIPELIKGSSSVLKNNKTMILLIQYTFIAITGGILQTTFSLFAGLRLGLEPFTVGILLTLLGVYQIIFRLLLFNRLRDKIGDPITVLLGLGTYIVSYLFLAFVSQAWELMVILGFISFAGSMSQGIITGFISRSVDNRNQGKIMGISTGIDNLAQIIGPIAGGLLLSLSGNLPYALVLSLLSVFPFIIAFRVLKFGYDNRKTVIPEEITPEIIKPQIVS